MRRRKCYNTWHIIKTVKPKQGIKLDFLKYYNIYKHENINWLQSYYPNMESHLYGMEKASLFSYKLVMNLSFLISIGRLKKHELQLSTFSSKGFISSG